MVDELFIRIISWGLGLLFLSAALSKLTAPARLRGQLRDYQLLPASLVTPVSVVIIAVECLLAAGWWSGAWPLFTISATVVLLWLYGAGMGINLLRGRRHIDCGCSFAMAGSRSSGLSWGLVLRNGLLSLLALIPLLPIAQRDLGWLDQVTTAITLLALLIFYTAVNQLIANQTAINVWRSARG